MTQQVCNLYYILQNKYNDNYSNRKITVIDETVRDALLLSLMIQQFHKL